MAKFSEWCQSTEKEINKQTLHRLTAQPENIDKGVENTTQVVPEHYASPSRLAGVLRILGKEGVAKLLEEKLPRTAQIRSGDLGEILATEYIDEKTEFHAPIKRLRWKDHREMAMRGEDVIGVIAPNGNSPIKFLKTEAKSRAALRTSVVEEARKALDGGNGLPSGHALTFISERLHEMNESDLAIAIDLASLRDGISAKQMQHMLFTVSGNTPDSFLTKDLENYSGSIPQQSVGIQIDDHQEFIKKVFEGLKGDEK